MNKKRAYIYARVSTVMQEDSDALNNQLVRLRQFCSFKDFSIEKELTDVESGAVDDRPAFLELQSAIKNKKFDVLIVTELSRISRKLNSILDFIQQLQNNNIEFISITQNFDTSNAMGRAMLKLVATFAEFEREQVSERVKHTLHSISKQGRYLGSNVFGYKREDKKLIVIPEEALIIKNIFSDFLSGESRSSIAKKYEVSITAITTRLQNPVYIGKVRFGQLQKNIVTGKRNKNDNYILVDGLHEAIIEQDTFNKTQKLLKSIKRKNIKITDNPNYLLGGLVTCYCGKKMYGVKNNKGRMWYRCSDDNCKKRYVHSEDLENDVIERIKKFQTNPEELQNIQKIDNCKSITTNSDNILILEKNKESYINQKERLLNLYIMGSISNEEFKIKENEILKKIKNTDEDINLLKDKLNFNDLDIKNSEFLFELIENFNFHDRMDMKRLLNIIIKEVHFINNFEYEIIFNI